MHTCPCDEGKINLFVFKPTIYGEFSTCRIFNVILSVVFCFDVVVVSFSILDMYEKTNNFRLNLDCDEKPERVAN